MSGLARRGLAFADHRREAKFVELITLVLLAVVLSWALTGLLLRQLSGPRHLAQRNERTMHERPTPTGGGIAFVGAVLTVTLIWLWPVPWPIVVVLTSMGGLAVVSAFDQYLPVWQLTRLLAQALAVAICLSLIPETVRIMPQLDLWQERGLEALAWLWLINLTNFMDGIDGIAGAQGIAVALGYVVVMHWPLPSAVTVTPSLLLALALAGACLGYLVWNWHPARIFMGDAGSIPLGFLLGWLMLDLAQNGKPAAAVILPLTFVADATLTLLRRVLSGSKPWQPHRTHLYQRAVSGGAAPPMVVGLFTLANAALIALAVHATTKPLGAMVAATAVILALWGALATMTQGRAHSPSADKQT